MVPDIRANPYLYIQLADSQQPRNCWACQRGIGVHKNIAATSLRSAAACSRAGGVARHIGIDDRLTPEHRVACDVSRFSSRRWASVRDSLLGAPAHPLDVEHRL